MEIAQNPRLGFNHSPEDPFQIYFQILASQKTSKHPEQSHRSLIFLRSPQLWAQLPSQSPCRARVAFPWPCWLPCCWASAARASPCRAHGGSCWLRPWRHWWRGQQPGRKRRSPWDQSPRTGTMGDLGIWRWENGWKTGPLK